MLGAILGTSLARHTNFPQEKERNFHYLLAVADQPMIA